VPTFRLSLPISYWKDVNVCIEHRFTVELVSPQDNKLSYRPATEFRENFMADRSPRQLLLIRLTQQAAICWG
jgi:hypothetical protein